MADHANLFPLRCHTFLARDLGKRTGSGSVTFNHQVVVRIVMRPAHLQIPTSSAMRHRSVPASVPAKQQRPLIGGLPGDRRRRRR